MGRIVFIFLFFFLACRENNTQVLIRVPGTGFNYNPDSIEPLYYPCERRSEIDSMLCILGPISKTGFVRYLCEGEKEDTVYVPTDIADALEMYYGILPLEGKGVRKLMLYREPFKKSEQ
jgi:hypothetical protein